MSILELAFGAPDNGFTVARCDLQGTQQTEPGAANRLALAISDLTGAVRKSSSPFSVAAVASKIEYRVNNVSDGAAIPNRDKQGNPINYFGWLGVQYRVIVHSDSGEVLDLDKVAVKEHVTDEVQTKLATGAMFKIQAAFQSPALAEKTKQQFFDFVPYSLGGLLGPAGQAVDTLRTEFYNYIEGLSKANNGALTGTITNNQFWLVTDARTGTTDQNEKTAARVIESGSSHTVNLTLDTVQKQVVVTVKKTATDNNGVQKAVISAASQSEEQVTIRKP